LILDLKYGLLPAPQPPVLRFGSYLKTAQLRPVPAVFGHQSIYPADGWGMLLNGGHGAISDCTVAGAMHCAMLWNKIAGKDVSFTDTDASEDYFAITGGTDTGADMVSAAQYWQKTGFRDATGARHKIFAFMAVDPQNLDSVFRAAYEFDAVGLGIQMPSSAQRQFIYNRPWSNVLLGENIDGYHYVPLMGHAFNGNAVVVTWGRTQEVELSWLGRNLVECVAMISEEVLVGGKSPEGFDMSALQDDLDAIGAA
jgi:hypothetical protein